MANDLMARQLALQALSNVDTLTVTDVSGLGTAATKNVGTSAGQVPLTDANGKILISVIPDSIASGQLYKGVWDASTGVLPTSTIVGEFYIVSVTGAVGAETYNKNDQIIWNGTSYDHIDNAQLVTFAEDIKRRGFVDRTSTEVPYLSGASMDVINLDDAGAGWSYYKNGVKYTISGNRTIEITGGAGNAHTNGIYWVTISDDNGTLAITQTVPSIVNDVIVAYVYWNESLPVGSQSQIGDERHTIAWDSGVHDSIHRVFGAQADSDVILSGYTLDSTVDAQKQYSLSSTNLYDEDIRITIPALVGGNGKYTNFYRTSETCWGWESGSNYPFRFASGGRLLYDSVTGGTECGDNKFINTFSVISNLSGVAQYITITSQQEYSTVSEARREHFSDLALGGLFLNEMIVTHRITWNTNDLFVPSTGKCKIVYTRPIMENYTGLKQLYKTRTNDVEPSLDRRYVTDAQLAVLEDTSGENSGDETKTSIITKLEFTPVESNSAITGATKTKVTYDAKGLVTAGTDATTSDIADSTNKRYVTDAEKSAITHTNRSSLDTIDQNLATTSDVTFNNVLTSGYLVRSVGNITVTSGTINNLVIPASSFIKITSSTGNFTIAGIAGGASGRVLTIYNASTNNMSISNEGTTSTASNRILTMGGSLNGNGASNVTMVYDAAQSRWIVVSSMT